MHPTTGTLFASWRKPAPAAEPTVHSCRIAQTEHPDLILSDILMPVMDGFELAQKIRTDTGLAGIPILSYSATYEGPQAAKLSQALIPIVRVS
jgi:CheY-like chemotaxis protein